MRDMIGNKVKAGDLLLWLHNHFIVEVLEASDGEDPRVEVPGRKAAPRTGVLTFKITMPVDCSKLPSGVEPGVTDFVRVANPKEAQTVDRIMERMGGPALMPPRKQ